MPGGGVLIRRTALVLLPAWVALALSALAITSIDDPLASGERPSPADDRTTPAGMDRFPLLFVQNRGQAAGPVDYYVAGEETAIGFSPGSASIVLTEGRERYGLRLTFPGGRAVAPQPRSEAETTYSWFVGSPDRWVTSVPTFERLVYPDLWPGIALAYAGSTDGVKYRFTVAPGADPSVIRMAWEGARSLTVDGAGRLVLSTPIRRVTDPAPSAWQMVGGVRMPVDAAWETAGSTASFRVGSYDPSLPLIVDPVMFVWAGYIGGAVTDRAQGIAVDAAGSAYVTGHTESSHATFPDGDGFGTLTGPDTTYNAGNDAFVAKVKADGSGLDWAGYIGGSNGEDYGTAIAVDGNGNAYVAGTTFSTSTSFPDGDGFGALGGPDTSFNGGPFDAFVAKVKADGSGLHWAGYVGGTAYDAGQGIAVDTDGAAYITGLTYSDATSFPDGDGFGGLGGFDTSHNGDGDAFVVKVSADGTGFDWAGYIGGSNFDMGLGIAATDDSVHVAGSLRSDQSTFPDGDGFGTLTGPDTTYNGGPGDGFVAEVAADGSALSWAGYVGGDGFDQGWGVAVDGLGRTYATGMTQSNQFTFPDGDGFGTVPGPDRTQNGQDAWGVRVAADGSGLEWATYIGGNPGGSGRAVAVDGSGGAYFTGEMFATEATFPDGDGMGTLTGPDVTHNGGSDAFVVKVSADGSAFEWASFLGGSASDAGLAIAVRSGDVYVAGETYSTEASFPDGDGFGTLDSPDPTFNSSPSNYPDGFMAKISGGECPGYEGVPGNHIIGTDGPETLVGTAGIDVICGMGGADVLDGLNGADILDGGEGADLLKGRGGADDLFGGEDGDVLRGGAGPDELYGGAGNDALTGHGGLDLLHGDGGADRLNARDGLGGEDVDGGTEADTCRTDPTDVVTSCP